MMNKVKKKKEDYDYEINGHIPYPPDLLIFEKGKEPSWILSDTDLIKGGKSEECIALMCKESEFKKTKNPVLAIEAFVLAHDMRVYPPLWVIEFFAAAFKKYHDKLGLVDLDSVLGLKGVGKKGGAFGPLLKAQRDEMLMLPVFRLIRLGYPPHQAASIVARFFENVPEQEFNKTWIKIKKLNETTILDLYTKKWSKIFKDEERNKDIKKINDRWLKDNKEKFMQQFKNVLSEEELALQPRRKR